jgi:hypothetical protein
MFPHRTAEVARAINPRSMHSQFFFALYLTNTSLAVLRSLPGLGVRARWPRQPQAQMP